MKVFFLLVLGMFLPAAIQAEVIEDQFTSSDGNTGAYKINFPESYQADGTTGMLLYLHVDGAIWYHRVFEPNARLAERHGLISMTAHSPDGKSWWHLGNSELESYFHELMEHLIEKYQLNRREIYFTGGSGGAMFLSAMFLPLYGYLYGGGALFLCGGDPNFHDPTFNYDDEFLENFPMYFYTLRRDYTQNRVRQAIAYYRGKGMQVQPDLDENGGHCMFSGSIDGALARKLKFILKDN